MFWKASPNSLSKTWISSSSIQFPISVLWDQVTDDSLYITHFFNQYIIHNRHDYFRVSCDRCTAFFKDRPDLLSPELTFVPAASSSAIDFSTVVTAIIVSMNDAAKVTSAVVENRSAV